MYIKTGIIAVAAFLFVGIAMADDQTLDVTIRVIQSPNDLPAAVTRTIELPVAASDRARERSRQGLETANQARESGRAFGQGIADEARTRRGRP